MTNLSAYRRVVDGMWADPELTGDLLAIGVYWAGLMHLAPMPGKLSGRDAARAVFGDMGVYTVKFGEETYTHDRAEQQFLKTMRADIRRYDSQADPRNAHRWTRPCIAPMIRRDGECGKPGSSTGADDIHDLETGEWLSVARCPRHIAWAEQQARTNRAAWKALGDQKPTPPANTGGVLRRHLPEVDWPTYWRSLDERWVEPPERVPFIRPTLTVMITDDVEPTPDGPRPSLTLVPS